MTQHDYRFKAMKGSLTMASKTEIKNEARKSWTAPELRRLDAGSAEQGRGNIADGGAPATPRS
jgi:hypothetical protein